MAGAAAPARRGSLLAEIGQMIGGRYQLVELLREGAYSTEFRAQDTQLDRDVEVKLLRPEYAQNLDFLSDLRWQARAAAGLNHENIAAVYDFGTDGAGTYLVTEYVDGADLATLLERNGPVPKSYTAAMFSWLRPAAARACQRRSDKKSRFWAYSGRSNLTSTSRSSCVS